MENGSLNFIHAITDQPVNLIDHSVLVYQLNTGLIYLQETILAEKCIVRARLVQNVHLECHALHHTLVYVVRLFTKFINFAGHLNIFFSLFKFRTSNEKPQTIYVSLKLKCKNGLTFLLYYNLQPTMEVSQISFQMK